MRIAMIGQNRRSILAASHEDFIAVKEFYFLLFLRGINSLAETRVENKFYSCFDFCDE